VQQISKVAVIGGGSFGTVIASTIAGNGHDVGFWMRSDELAQDINSRRENPQYLPGYEISERVVATDDMSTAISVAELVFVAVPSPGFRAVVREMLRHASPEAMLVSGTKGIEAESFSLMSQILRQESPQSRVGVLSGPNLAREIAAGHLTGTVIASDDEDVRDSVRSLLRSESFRVYVNDDMLGVELGGSLKNIYAIIAGIAAALGMGHNTNSMLVTRALTEMARFGSALGADPMTFLGLSGVGDLVVTSSTPLSRNYRIGFALGKGRTIAQAIEEVGQVAEGVNTVRLVTAKADELGVYMPLAQGLYRIIEENRSISSILSSLMLSEQALDVEFVASSNKTLRNGERP